MVLKPYMQPQFTMRGFLEFVAATCALIVLAGETWRHRISEQAMESLVEQRDAEIVTLREDVARATLVGNGAAVSRDSRNQIGVHVDLDKRWRGSSAQIALLRDFRQIATSQTVCPRMSHAG